MVKNLIYALIINALIIIGFIGCSNEPTDPGSDPIDANNNGFETREVAEVFVNNCVTSAFILI